jgi:hypothetical protein
MYDHANIGIDYDFEPNDNKDDCILGLVET